MLHGNRTNHLSQIDSTKPLILLRDNVLRPNECEYWIRTIVEAGPEPATINTLGGAVIRNEVRNNRRVILDEPEWANVLFDRVKDKVPNEIHGMTLVGVNERFRFYEYKPGQHFAPHLDGAFYRDETEQSWYTFMVYLNEGFKGGETVFLVEPEKSITPKTGMALLFQHHIIHTGSKVKSGIKYVLRTDLMYRKV